MKKFIVLILIANTVFIGKYFYEKKSSHSQKTLQQPILKNTKEDFSMEKNRDNISQQYKWNLNDIYPNWNEWDKDLIKLKELMAEIPKYEGKISQNSTTFIEFVELEEKVSRLLDKIY
ncbi:MAG: oligoendopeptidase F, partial [Cetobacterium sp.]